MTSDGDGPPSTEVLHRIAVDLAVRAARRVRQAVEPGAVSPDRSVESKSTPTDLVTGTDRDIERFLVREIVRLRPGDGVLGEEGGERSAADGSRVRWVVDPIDGTVNFVLGLPLYAVSVAAELDGEVVAGAVANPASGEVFHAWRGGGAWVCSLESAGTAEDKDTADGTAGDNGTAEDAVSAGLHGPRDVPLSRAVVATGFGYDASRRARQIAVVAQLLPRIADLRRLGAASLDLCLLAAGRLDAYFEAGLNPWDHAAGGLVAREAGCVVTGPGGHASEQLLVAAGPRLIDELVAVLDGFGAADVVGAR